MGQIKNTITALLILNVFVVLFAFSGLEPWVYMWAIAFSLFFWAKWMTLVYNDKASVGVLGSVFYLTAWVGMDPAPFEKKIQTYWDAPLFFKGSRNILFGILLFAIVHTQPHWHWYLKAWMMGGGIIFCLHFGSFHLLAFLR